MRLLVAAAAATLVASSAGAVQFVNGSFEDGTDPGSFTTVAAGGTEITGWTVMPDGVDYIGSYWAASDGSRSLDLSALNSGGVSQTLTGFTIGKHYRVTFDVSANPDSQVRPKRLVVSASSGDAVIYAYENTTNTATDMAWVTYTYDFVAGNVMQMIKFQSLENNSFGPALDNVSISVIPEPAAWGLMIAGFAMTGLAARRRRRMPAATA